MTANSMTTVLPSVNIICDVGPSSVLLESEFKM